MLNHTAAIETIDRLDRKAIHLHETLIKHASCPETARLQEEISHLRDCLACAEGLIEEARDAASKGMVTQTTALIARAALLLHEASTHPFKIAYQHQS